MMKLSPLTSITGIRNPLWNPTRRLLPTQLPLKDSFTRFSGHSFLSNEAYHPMLEVFVSRLDKLNKDIAALDAPGIQHQWGIRYAASEIVRDFETDFEKLWDRGLVRFERLKLAGASDFGHSTRHYYRRLGEAVQSCDDSNVVQNLTALVGTFKEVIRQHQEFADPNCQLNATHPAHYITGLVSFIGKGLIFKNKTLQYTPEPGLEQRPLQNALSNHDWFLLVDNLLGNADKYTPGEGSSIQITLDRVKGAPTGDNGWKVSPDGQDYLAFSVTDNGIGIPTAEQTRVRQGHRAKNAIDAQIYGTGKGLERVQEIISAANGVLTLESPVHSDAKMPGTRITCYIPIL